MDVVMVMDIQRFMIIATMLDIQIKSLRWSLDFRVFVSLILSSAPVIESENWFVMPSVKGDLCSIEFRAT